MVYLSSAGGGVGQANGWGEVVLPSPGSEPPPPYSPPRVPHHHQHFFPPGFPNHHHHHHFYHPITDYFDLASSSQPPSITSTQDMPSIKDPPPPYPPTSTLKAAHHAALNHGPSSAFSPPAKSLKYCCPPPYTATDSGPPSLMVVGDVKGKDPHGRVSRMPNPFRDASARSHDSSGGATRTLNLLGGASRSVDSIVEPTRSYDRYRGTPGSCDLAARPSTLHDPPGGVSRIQHGHNTDPRQRMRRSRGAHHQQEKTRSLDHREDRGGFARVSSTSRSSSGGRSQDIPLERVHGHTTTTTSSSSIVHPRGPLRKTGKSLELPHERLSHHHHPPPTTHTHPTPIHNHHHNHTKDVAAAPHHPHHQHSTKESHRRGATQSHSKSSSNNKLAYIGILPTKAREGQKPSKLIGNGTPDNRWMAEGHTEDRWAAEGRAEDRRVAKTSRLEAAAARAMMPVRAVPVTTHHPSAHHHQHQSLEAGNLGRGGRMRWCRSLDELSDLLEEESLGPRPPVFTRSLDDLTEPLYENVDIIHAHNGGTRSRHAHSQDHNTSVPDLVEPPPRPPRHRNNSLSSLLDDLAISGVPVPLTRRGLNTSVPDVLEGSGWTSRDGGLWGGASSPTSTLRSAASTTAARDHEGDTSDIAVQLQKIREVARVLDVKYRRGELSSSSASSSGPPSTHTSPRVPTHAHNNIATAPAPVPGVPARAPVIHDILRDTKKTSPGRGEPDAASQESGYSSFDSRSYRLHQHNAHLQHSSSLPANLQQQPQQSSKKFQDGHKDPQPRTASVESQTGPIQNRPRRQQRQESVQQKDSLLNGKQQSQERQQSISQSSPRHRQRYEDKQLCQLRLQQPVQQLQLQQGVNQDQLGIYIKSVVPGGAAHQDGRLQAGDQLLSVDGKSLIGISQERAAEYMMETGPVVTLEVARQGAIYHGLATLLSQPSPQVNRASVRKMRPRTEEVPAATMTNSHSTPNMGGYNERLVDWNQPPRQHPLPPTSSHSSLMARSSPNLAAPPEGYHGGRHMSERDLPSKVLREHSEDSPAPHHQPPRMQASKSVPSLNSDPSSSIGGKPASLEVFNPSYSRTSSNTSLSHPPNSHLPHHPHQHPQHHQQPQQQQPPVRSRSTQNLSEGSYPGVVGRHPSNPSLALDEERYYQNVNFHQGTQDPRMGSTRTRPGPAQPMSSPSSKGPEQMRTEQSRPDSRPEHRPASAFLQREDLVPTRADLQRPASQRDVRVDAKMMEMAEEVRRREERMRHNGYPAGPQQQQRPGPHQLPHRMHNTLPPSGAPFLPEGYSGSQSFSSQHPGYHQATSQPMSPQAGHQQHPQHLHSQYPGHPQGFLNKLPPPTAPKPKSQGGPHSSDAPEKPSRQYGHEGAYLTGDGPPRPPPPEDSYRDSPPPPPPPTSTHPLLQATRPTSSVGYSTNSSHMSSKSAFNKTNPWDREEKERNDRRRREAVRHWRDEQISSLENLELRTTQQDERLRTLRLEKEFQRRAEEALSNNDDDDDEEEEEEEEIENEDGTQQSTENALREINKLPNSILSTSGPEPRINGGGPVDEERARKVDEIRRKQQELEAASEVEERLLREAQRRQQEEQLQQQQKQQLQQQQLQQQQQQMQQPTGYSHHPHYQHQHHASQRLDSLVATSFHPQYNNGPVNGSRGSRGSFSEYPAGNESSHRIDTPVTAAQHSPVPPERGSSYSVMQQQQTPVPTHSGANNRYKGSDTPTSTIKRVQFSETPTVDTHITYDNNANQEKTPRQDPNHTRSFPRKNFINEAETMLNSSPTRNNSSTPGVIGAQEVYRDPRMRRLQQKQAEQAAAKNPGPEKLTFKEKMKMFAMETGEAETPKDKVKISRAQRDIEH